MRNSHRRELSTRYLNLSGYERHMTFNNFTSRDLVNHVSLTIEDLKHFQSAPGLTGSAEDTYAYFVLSRTDYIVNCLISFAAIS
ncbi:hypothetical protein WAI453_002150 [Rhynchosporium graminicola]